ncbi:hypothetical protein AHAS_Ahas11G0122800 [Arachis hypogaea]
MRKRWRERKDYTEKREAQQGRAAARVLSGESGAENILTLWKVGGGDFSIVEYGVVEYSSVENGEWRELGNKDLAF